MVFCNLTSWQFLLLACPYLGLICSLSLIRCSNGPFQTIVVCRQFGSYWVILYVSLSSEVFVKKNTFSKSSFRIPSVCQTVLIMIRPDSLLSLTRVQPVCKGYEQMTKVATSRERNDIEGTSGIYTRT